MNTNNHMRNETAWIVTALIALMVVALICIPTEAKQPETTGKERGEIVVSPVASPAEKIAVEEH